MKAWFKIAAVFLFAIISSLAFADIIISLPRIGNFSQEHVEVGSTPTVTVKYRNTTGKEICIDRLSLILTFESAVIDCVLETKNLVAEYFYEENKESTEGSILFDISRKSSPAPIPNGAEIDLLEVMFHVNQGIAVSSSGPNPLNIFELFSSKAVSLFSLGEESVVMFGEENVTGKFEPRKYFFERSKPPDFSGLSSAQSENDIGNTVILEWITPANSAKDWTPFHNRKLHYKVMRSTSELFDNNVTEWTGEVNADPLLNPKDRKPYTGNLDVDYTLRDGPGINMAGLREAGQPLSDGRIYYYKIIAMDDCTPIPNEKKDTVVLSVVPLDLTPPPDVVNFKAEMTKGMLSFTWGWEDPPADLGGVVIVRNEGRPVGDGYLQSAQAGFPYQDGLEYQEGEEPFGEGKGKVVYVSYQEEDAGMVPTKYEDYDVESNKTYYYKIFSYDRVVGGDPREMGRNYSKGVGVSVKTEVPSSISPIANLRVGKGECPGEIVFYWTSPEDESYSGTLILYSTDQWKKWNGISIGDGKIAGGRVAVNLPSFTGPGREESEYFEGEEGKKYYFAAYAYSFVGEELDPYDEESMKQVVFSEPVWAAIGEEVPPRIKIWLGDKLWDQKEQMTFAPGTKIKVEYVGTEAYGLRVKPVVLDADTPAAQSFSVGEIGAYTTERSGTGKMAIDYVLPAETKEGKHTLSFYAESMGNVYEAAQSIARIMFEVGGGPLRLTSLPLTYPSPFSIQKDRTVTVQYGLSEDADIEVYITNVGGERVKRFNINAGEEGGKSGLNKLTWDGSIPTGGFAANGMYVGTIVAKEEGRLLGKFKLVMVD